MGLNKHGRIVSSSLGGISVEMGITGKFAVVTGGGAGIGQAIALALAQEGARISILDVNLEVLVKLHIRSGNWAVKLLFVRPTCRILLLLTEQEMRSFNTSGGSIY